jgi:hypothetical protein
MGAGPLLITLGFELKKSLIKKGKINIIVKQFYVVVVSKRGEDMGFSR